MHQDNDGHIHVNQEEASGGSKEGVVRWVLVLGLILAIGLLSVTWITGALTKGEIEEEGDVSGQISATEDNGNETTDSVVSDEFAPVEGSAPAGTAASTETPVPESAE